MSKNKTIYLVFFGLLFSSQVFAGAVCQYYPGAVICGKGTVDNVYVLGLATIDGTAISGTFGVTGAVNASNAVFNKVGCLGNIQIKDSAVNGFFDTTGLVTAENVSFHNKLRNIGILTAVDSNFADAIEITTTQLSFKNSTTKNITVHRDEHPAPKVYLQMHSLVDGNIVFESGDGVVIESEGSEVKGKVVGGTIVKLGS